MENDAISRSAVEEIARWIPSWEPLDLSDVYFRCSACHTNFNVGTEIDMEMAKYCPKCGARMDGETDAV